MYFANLLFLCCIFKFVQDVSDSKTKNINWYFPEKFAEWAIHEGINGLAPKYTEEDYNNFVACEDKKADSKMCSDYKNLIISMANFLYKIELDDKDKKLLWKALRKNKNMLKSLEMKKEGIWNGFI